MSLAPSLTELPSPSSDGGPFQILTLDGGGIKGIFSAAVLAALEDDFNCEIRDHFDLIAGTSTGGIIALALGLGIRPRGILDFYVRTGPSIFPRGHLRDLLKWVRVKYSEAPLERAVKECFGERLFGESAKRLVIPSFNLGDDEVYIFRTAHHEKLRRDYKEPAWKVALATTAAPTYFPSHRSIGSIRLIDGGVWANNPTMVAVTEAKEALQVALSRIRIFSLGTSDPVVRRPRRLDAGGMLAWARGNHGLDVILRGQNIAADNQARLLVGKGNVLRLNPAVAPDHFSLDGVKDAQDLIGKAMHVSRQIAPDFSRLFAAHHAPVFVPLYP